MGLFFYNDTLQILQNKNHKLYNPLSIYFGEYGKIGFIFVEICDILIMPVSSDNNKEETPISIPNIEVKLLCA